MAEHNSFIPDLRVQVEMARELIQVLSSLMCCCILSKFYLPSFCHYLNFAENKTGPSALHAFIINSDHFLVSKNAHLSKN